MVEPGLFPRIPCRPLPLPCKSDQMEFLIPKDEQCSVTYTKVISRFFRLTK